MIKGTFLDSTGSTRLPAGVEVKAGNQMTAGKTAETDSEARGHKPNF